MSEETKIEKPIETKDIVSQEGLMAALRDMVIAAVKSATATPDKVAATAKADAIVHKIALPPELQKRQKLLEVAMNGSKNGDETKALVDEYWRHQFLRGSYVSDVPFDAVCKSLTTTGAGTGAELVAVQYITEYIRRLENVAEFRPWVRQWTMTQNSMDVPIVVQGHTAAYRGETVEITATGSTTSNLTLTAKSLGCLTTPISRELVADSRFPLTPLIAELLNEACKRKEQNVFAIGSDATTPYGIENVGYSSIAQEGSTPAFNDIINLMHLLPVPYRKGNTNARCFMGNDATAKIIAKIKDDDGLPIFSFIRNTTGPLGNILAQTVHGEQGTLLGVPFVWLPDITGAATSGSKTTLFYGDFNRGYYWGDRVGDTGQVMELESTTEAGSNFVNHTLQVKCVTRNDGQGADVRAVVKLTGVYV